MIEVTQPTSAASSYAAPLREDATLQLASEQSTRPSLLMFHGWAASSAIWQPVIDELRGSYDVITIDLPGHGKAAADGAASVDAFLDALLDGSYGKLPERFALLGWSLGGVLAARLAQRLPDRVWALVLVATNQQFVATEQWPDAVTAKTYASFQQQLEAGGASSQFMRRFWQLQCRGSVDARSNVRQLAGLLESSRFEGEMLSVTLAWLQQQHLPAVDNLPMPVLHQFGDRDELVPVHAAQRIRRLATRARSEHDYRVTVFRQSAHLPFLSETRAWLEQTTQFLDQASRGDTSQPVDKRAVARAFSKAAGDYDRYASLQYRLGSELLEQLPSHAANRILDLGAGTGKLGAVLSERYPLADLVQLDLSANMLDRCRERKLNAHPVQADFDALPFADGVFDLVYSNLALQWCYRLEPTLSALGRTLAPGGLLLMTTLVSGSMQELGRAWSNIDNSEHVNRFYEQHSWLAAVEKAGLMADVWQLQTRTEHFEQLSDLLASVRGIGAGNAATGRPMGLTGKQRYASFVQNYEAMRTADGQLPLSYNIITAVLRRPGENHQ